MTNIQHVPFNLPTQSNGVLLSDQEFVTQLCINKQTTLDNKKRSNLYLQLPMIPDLLNQFLTAIYTLLNEEPGLFKQTCVSFFKKKRLFPLAWESSLVHAK